MTCQKFQFGCGCFGTREGHQRYQCTTSNKVRIDPRNSALGKLYPPVEKAEMILRLLFEGKSVSSVSRLLDVHIATILKLLVKAGKKGRANHGAGHPPGPNAVTSNWMSCWRLWARIRNV